MTMANKRIGVICAMASELKDLVSNLEGTRIENHSGYEFYIGTMGSREVILVQCGVGLVNAARGTQVMIDRYEPAVVVNSGAAGGTGEGLAIGDIVVGTSFVQHNFDATAFGYAKGYQCNGIDNDKPTVYTADEDVVEALILAAKAISEREGTPDVPRNVHAGRIASGDVFVATVERKTEIREQFGAVAAEMEGSAIAQTAYYAGVPCAVLRVVSDLADGTQSESYQQFEDAAAEFSASVIIEFIMNC